MKIRSKNLKHLFCVPASLLLLAPAIVAIQLNNTKSDTAHALKASSIFPNQGTIDGGTEITIEGMFNGMVDIVQISAGYYHSLALDSNGQIYAWGDNGHGQLGDGGYDEDQSSPVAVDTTGVLAGKEIIQIVAGDDHSLALDSDGQVYAWGEDEYGQLGNGDDTDEDQPSPVAVDTTGVLAGKEIIQIATGDNHSLALDSDGQVYVWGEDGYGELGDGGANINQSSPVVVDTSGVLAGKTIVQIVAVYGHSLALDSDGQVYAWGRDSSGQLGDGGANIDQPSPVAVDTSGVLDGKTVTQIAAGSNHSLALDSDGQVYAWGYDGSGQLGDGGANTNQPSPVAVDATGILDGKTIVQIAAGSFHSFALDSDGQVYAWGEDEYGQLGDGGINECDEKWGIIRYCSSPVAVDTSGVLDGKTVTQIAAGSNHSLALDSDGQVYAWGEDEYGQLGDGDDTDENQPSPVPVDTNPTTSALGYTPDTYTVTIDPLGTPVECVNVVMVNINTLTCITTAHTEGLVDVIISDEINTYTLTNAFEYTEDDAPEVPDTPTEDTDDTDDTDDTKATEATVPRVPNTGVK